MPETEHAEESILEFSLNEGLELNIRLFLEMQIKKMKEIIPQLYTNQVNDRNNSLATSPKQLNCEHMNQPNGREAQLNDNQDAVAEDDVMSTAPCVRYESTQNPHHDLNKDNQQNQNEEQVFYLCVSCNLPVSPTLPGTNDNPGAVDSGNKDNSVSQTINNQLKVKNFQPSKYYCDKCRFSTNDSLQYKKHTLQHEETKFFCSQCNYVSYTKGEFQSHLARHTYPYHCDLCDFSAVRNDSIIKHTRQVHEASGEKRPLIQSMEQQPKRANFSKQNSEVLENEVSDSNSFLTDRSDSPVWFPIPEDEDKKDCVISLPESKECGKNAVASAPDKACLPEPSKVNLFENENVEVELISPAKEPVQPGMPLTVVAPAELRVPANCLAQLIDVKVVNGTQQLVLKLIPLKEKNGLKTGNSDEGKYEPTSTCTVPNEQEKLVPTEQTPPAAEKKSPEKPLGLSNMYSTDYTPMKDPDLTRSSASQVFQDKSETNQNQCATCAKRSRLGDWRPEMFPVPFGSTFSPVSSRDIGMEQHNYFSPLPLANNGAFYNPMKRMGVFPHMSALSPYQDRSQNLFEKPPSVYKPADTFMTFAERRILPASSQTPLYRNEVDTFKMAAFNEKLNQAQAKEPSVQDYSLRRGEQSHMNLIRENDIKTQDPDVVMLEDYVGVPVQDSGSNVAVSDGPVISSVFSLSCGAENIPEGIRWDNESCRTDSVSSHGRISQLVAVSDPPRAFVSSCIVEHRSTPLKAPIDCVQGRNAPIHPVLPQRLQNSTANIEHIVYEQMEHQNSEEEQTRVREARMDHSAIPLLIPKATVSKAFSSTENEYVAKSKLPNDVFGSSLSVPKSSPFKSFAEDLSLKNRSQPIDSSRNLSTSLGNKPNQEYVIVSNKSTSTCPPPKEDSDQDEERPGPSGLQSNMDTSNEAAQSDSNNSLPDVCIFMTSRHLRLVAVKAEQLIKCPRRNQPVVVLNHPDVDSIEVINVMKVVNKYKGNVLKVVLSERTCDQLGLKRHHKRLIYHTLESVCPVKKQTMLKMKLKKIHKNSYQVVDSLPGESVQGMFKCWFCGRIFEDQEEWMSHGQRHLIEATRDWEQLSPSVGTPK